jgi:death-on-curing protein
VNYLSLADARFILERSGCGPVRDMGLLDSTLARPRASADGHDVYPQVDLKIAALLHSLASNHALVDHNKRGAWILTVVFANSNQWQPQLTTAEVVALITDIANGLSDLDLIAQRLALMPHITSGTPPTYRFVAPEPRRLTAVMA